MASTRTGLGTGLGLGLGRTLGSTLGTKAPENTVPAPVTTQAPKLGLGQRLGLNRTMTDLAPETSVPQSVALGAKSPSAEQKPLPLPQPSPLSGGLGAGRLGLSSGLGKKLSDSSVPAQPTPQPGALKSTGLRERRTLVSGPLSSGLPTFAGKEVSQGNPVSPSKIPSPLLKAPPLSQEPMTVISVPARSLQKWIQGRIVKADGKDDARLAALDTLLTMVYPHTQSRILTDDDKELGMEVAVMLRYDPQMTLEFIRRSPSRESILWLQDALEVARKHAADEVKFLMAIPSGMVGVFICPFCKFNEVAMSLTQHGSGDEGLTTKYTCVRCGRTWGGR